VTIQGERRERERLGGRQRLRAQSVASLEQLRCQEKEKEKEKEQEGQLTGRGQRRHTRARSCIRFQRWTGERERETGETGDQTQRETTSAQAHVQPGAWSTCCEPCRSTVSLPARVHGSFTSPLFGVWLYYCVPLGSGCRTSPPSLPTVSTLREPPLTRSPRSILPRHHSIGVQSRFHIIALLYNAFQLDSDLQKHRS
jgi:hypothetical protein